jgi:uncharacterized protein
MLVVPKRAATDASKIGWMASRYNLFSDGLNGATIVANTLTGARAILPKAYAADIQKLQQPGSAPLQGLDAAFAKAMIELGVLVPADSNELRKLRYLQAHTVSSAKHLHLIVLPTEKCNFRCSYCYEDFKLGRMKPAMRQALKTYITTQAATLQSLSLDWFGGEPLLAFDVMADVLPEVKNACEKSGCRFTGHITTNGYYLTPDKAKKLLQWDLTSFQVTLDGPPEYHNDRRRLHPSTRAEAEAPRNDAGTFDRILQNLKELLALPQLFHLQIRTNYDLVSLPAMDGWIERLVREFGGDPRVRVDFCPIWADPCRVDVSIPVGGEKQRTYIELLSKAHRAGLRTNTPEYLQMGGMVCYAAKANSIVVRSDGRLAKCTVAFDLDYNDVGTLNLDGTLTIDVEKFAKWTASGLEEDSTCQKCSFSASCQGNACPLERFENGRRPCPPAKTHISESLQLTVPVT